MAENTFNARWAFLWITWRARHSPVNRLSLHGAVSRINENGILRGRPSKEEEHSA